MAAKPQQKSTPRISPAALDSSSAATATRLRSIDLLLRRRRKLQSRRLRYGLGGAAHGRGAGVVKGDSQFGRAGHRDVVAVEQIDLYLLRIERANECRECKRTDQHRYPQVLRQHGSMIVPAP